MAFGSTVPTIGAGTTIIFASAGAFAGFEAEVVSASCSSPPKDIDTTHLGTTPPVLGEFGGRNSISGLLNDIQITMTIHYDPDIAPPTTGDPAEVVITFPNGSDWTGDVLMESMTIQNPVEDKVSAEMVVNGTGIWTFTS